MSIDKILEVHIEKIPDKEVAVLLSGGVDSNSLAISAKRVGKDVHGYTFYMKGNPSYDYLKSKEVCEAFGFRFTPIEIDHRNVKEDFHILKEKYNCIKKTNFECTYPLLYTIPQIEQKYILTGLLADGHYGLSKKAMIHYSKNKETFDLFRHRYFSADNPGSIQQAYKICNEHSKQLIVPYFEKDVFEYFIKFTWEEINKPKQKSLIRDCYPEISVLKLKNHLNYQLCAGIDRLFETLLSDSEINFKNRKRMMDVYRDWSKI